MARILPLLFLVLLTLFGTVHAATQISEDLLELEYGENITLNMQEYSRMTVRIFEGSTLHLNVEDISIPLRVKAVHEDGSVLIDTSNVADQAPEFTIPQGNQTPLYFRHSKIKAVFFQPRGFRYSTNAQERSVQLFINVPLFTSGVDTGELPPEETPEPPSTEQTNDPYLKYFILAIAILIIALILIPPRVPTTKKKKSK